MHELEAERLRSEIKRNEAETARLETETRQMASKSQWQFWLKAFVAACLVVAWVIGYLGPILSMKAELADISTKILDKEKAKIKSERDDLAQERDLLASENEVLAEQLKTLQEKAEELTDIKEDLENMQKEYRVGLEQISQNAPANTAANRSAQSQLQDLVGVETQTRQIGEKLEMNLKRVSSIKPRVYVHVARNEQKDRLKPVMKNLQEAGFLVMGYEKVDAKDLPKKPDIKFFNEEETAEAHRIIEILSKAGFEAYPNNMSSWARRNKSKIRLRHYELWLSTDW